MLRHGKRLLILALAILSLFLGVIGLFLPLLQGWFFLAVGIILLSIAVPAVRDWRSKHTAKYPKLHERIQKIEDWLTKRLGEL